MLASLLSAATQWRIPHDFYIRLELANYNGGCAHIPDRCLALAAAYQINRLGIKQFFIITKCLGEIERHGDKRDKERERNGAKETDGAREREGGRNMDEITQN